MKPFTYALQTNDHTYGGSEGAAAPEVMIAVNDEATGLLLDTLSHSPTWKDSLLIVTEDDHVMALDAKMNFDSNALYRQPKIMELRDLDEEDPHEIEASRHELNYIKLDGNIACMVNGAGLAMATMDIIKLKGGQPANFLDVGGGATKDRVIEAFKLILADPSVQGVLINIFGGIVRCDMIAEAIIAAVKEVNVTVPVVVRLEGNNAEAGAKLLNDSGLKLTSAQGLNDAAEKIVAAVNG